MLFWCSQSSSRRGSEGDTGLALREVVSGQRAVEGGCYFLLLLIVLTLGARGDGLQQTGSIVVKKSEVVLLTLLTC